MGNYLSSIQPKANHISFPDNTRIITKEMVESYRDSVAHISIPKGVSTIGKCAFTGCTELTSITFPTSLTTIGDGAFNGCTGLTHLTLPDSLTTIEHGAFARCTGLNHLTFPDGLTSISKAAFYCCTGLTSVSLPNSLTTIGDYAFNYCTGLTDLTLPDSLTSIGKEAFAGCTNLETLFIPDSLAQQSPEYWQARGINLHKTRLVTKTDLRTFQNQQGLTEKKIDMPQAIINNTHLTFSEDTKIITQDMVKPYQNKITHITIPKGVTTIEASAFLSYQKLTHLTFPASLTTIGQGAFMVCKELTHLTFPDSLTTIEAGAFGGCSRLISVSFPNGLTTIGTCAFLDCQGLTHLTFPASLTSIGNRAFEDCINLQYIIIPQSLEHHDVAYWQDKDIDPARTRIITKTQLQAFARNTKVDSHTNIHEIATLFLADQGHVLLPQAREHLNTHQRITKLSLSNLFSLPIQKNLILPGFVKYQNLTIAGKIVSEALAPLGHWAVQAAFPLASWLSWHDIARIWVAKAKAPRKFCPPALQAAQIWSHQETANRHDKGYPKDDTVSPKASFATVSARASFAMQSLLSQRPRSTHANHHHPNYKDPRTSCTKN